MRSVPSARSADSRGLGAHSPAGSRGRAPGRGARGAEPPIFFGKKGSLSIKNSPFLLFLAPK